jgi:hypothetical protein
MALIPRTTRLGDDLMDVRSTPAAPVPGQPTTIDIVLRDSQSLRPIRSFELLHDRFLHLFVVSQDLAVFAHVHPHLGEDGRLSTSIVLPRTGAYQLFADFTPAGGTPQLLQRSIIARGSPDALYQGRAHLAPDINAKEDGGLRARVSAPDVVAGRQLLLTFAIEDAQTGAPVRDLEPYLGALGHLFSVSEDLADAFHSHPVAEISSGAGPDLTFQLAFARAGVDRVWLQVQRGTIVSTFGFTIAVLPADGH